MSKREVDEARALAGGPEVTAALGVVGRVLVAETGAGAGFAQHALATKFVESVILCRRQVRYGPHNINAAGLVGIAVQLMNKAGRLLTMGARDILDLPLDPGNESSDGPVDATIDGANYGTIGTMWLDGTWPGSPKASAWSAPEGGRPA